MVGAILWAIQEAAASGAWEALIHDELEAIGDERDYGVVIARVGQFSNVGIAVATPRGLLVPVIRNVDQKNMVAIASEISDIAKRAREGKTAPEELQGGCFTVTNIGSIGGTHFTPIVNVPEVAILGMGRAVERLVMVDGKIESRVMLPLSLSYDHRLIDGADAARFLTWIVDAIQEPLVLSLEG